MGRFSVVLLDDDGEEMGILKDALVGSRRFSVLAVCTSYELLHLVLGDLEDVPGAVICDIYMESKDGLAVCKKLRAGGRYQHTALFLITGDMPSPLIAWDAEKNEIRAIFINPYTMVGYELLAERLVTGRVV